MKRKLKKLLNFKEAYCNCAMCLENSACKPNCPTKDTCYKSKK